MRIVFMGTPDFAVDSLKILLQEGHKILFVVTQPDKKAGRGQKLVFPPVKEYALSERLRVEQPQSLNDEGFKNMLIHENPDAIVVAAYGKLLPPYIIRLPRFGCVNVHASLLPKYRGAAPIQWSIINGDTETGVTIMKMDEGMDTGDIILSHPVGITGYDTSGSLYNKLKVFGAAALKEAMSKLADDKLVLVKQDESQASYAPKITKRDGALDWTLSAKCLYDRIRAMNPAPSAYTFYKGHKLKIHRGTIGESCDDRNAGMIWGYFGKLGLGVVTGDGILYINEIQPENGKRMDISEYVRGHKIESGEYFTLGE